MHGHFFAGFVPASTFTFTLDTDFQAANGNIDFCATAVQVGTNGFIEVTFSDGTVLSEFVPENFCSGYASNGYNAQGVVPSPYLDTASITISSVPTTSDDFVSTLVNRTITIDVLANDNDADGDVLTIDSVTDPNHGTTTIIPGSPNKIEYQPDPNFAGIDFFEYTITDGFFFVTATVNVSIDGDLYVSSYNTNEILRYDGRTGAFLDVFASGNGLNGPVGVTFGPDGNLYVANYNADEILRFNGDTGAPLPAPSETGAVYVSANPTQLNGPVYLTFGNDANLYVTGEASNNVVRFQGPGGASPGDSMGVFATGITGAEGLDFGPDGNLYAASWNSGLVKRFDGTTGVFIDDFATGITQAMSLVFGPDGDLYVESFIGDNVTRFDGNNGTLVSEFVTAGSGGLNTPFDLIFGSDANLYAASRDSDTIPYYDGSDGSPLGDFVTFQSGGLDNPTGLTFGPRATADLSITKTSSWKTKRPEAGGSRFPERPFWAPSRASGSNWRLPTKFASAFGNRRTPTAACSPLERSHARCRPGKIVETVLGKIQHDSFARPGRQHVLCRQYHLGTLARYPDIDAGICTHDVLVTDTVQPCNVEQRVVERRRRYRDFANDVRAVGRDVVSSSP